MNIKILLVDDEQEFLEQSKLLWEKIGEGAEVDVTADPEVALNEAVEKDYDAVVADYQMPEMDGLELLKMLRERGDNTPFIILTGKGGEEVAIKALNLKAEGYIRKGSSPKEQYKKIVDTIFNRPVST